MVARDMGIGSRRSGGVGEEWGRDIGLREEEAFWGKNIRKGVWGSG